MHTITRTLASLAVGLGLSGLAVSAEWNFEDESRLAQGEISLVTNNGPLSFNAQKTLSTSNAAVISSAALLGQLVSSSLSLHNFAQINDLKASDFIDVTWRPNAGDTVNIANTELSRKTGVVNFEKIKSPQVEITNYYFGAGMFPLPPGSTYTFSASSMIERGGIGGQCTISRFSGAASGGYFTVRITRSDYDSVQTCSEQLPAVQSIPLTVTSKSKPSSPAYNYFLKVN